MMKYLIIPFLLVMLMSCGDRNSTQDVKHPAETVEKQIVVPIFNEDSAYVYVDEQVSFGPRVPGTTASKECAHYLINKMKSFGLDVQVQSGKVRAFDGSLLEMQNIISSYNPTAKHRVLLCAHWDSRPFADWDKDKSNFNTPIPGANDGASGVGVLMEVGRQLVSLDSSKGVDIIFFDCEDYGKPKGTQNSKVANDWCLGSQHWASNPHVRGYTARFGILLDMVGAKDAVFAMEGTSMFYAPDIMKRIWNAGHRLGYQKHFSYENIGSITDDHLYVNQYLNIPTIDIIQHDPTGSNSFFEHWHTVNDDMTNIDKETLDAVGQTVLEVVFRGL